ncbi:processive diacylglycerol beta-glucosyltransferase [Acrasis kona]|uniref:Processive diacylglycerol beta-glucosyltransferase n=1 Tax=Acrasis kona TaxID=1008807 RepID=A0AAW2ZGK5_9EUKA
MSSSVEAKIKFNKFLNRLTLQKTQPLTDLDANGSEKKRILIISSNGGGGHMSASRAIQDAVRGDYDTKIITPCDNVPGGDALFNKYMKKGELRKIKLLISLQSFADIDLSGSIANALDQELETFKPQLVISVMPVANYETYILSKKHKIPFLIVPTDLKFDHFFNFLKSPSDDLKVAIPFEDTDVTETIQKRKFQQHNFVVTGYPLRPEFGAPSDQLRDEFDGIRTELNIQDKEKIVVVMMGAQGSMKDTLRYINCIRKNPRMITTKENQTVHVVVMCGSNEDLRYIVAKAKITKPFSDLFSKKKHDRVKIHALGKKSAVQVAALLRFSNVFVSKPGGSSVNEALASEIFTLFDNRSGKYIQWEKENSTYAYQKGCSEEISMSKFPKQLRRALERRERPCVRSCPGRTFTENIRQQITLMINSSVVSQCDFGGLPPQDREDL